MNKLTATIKKIEYLENLHLVYLQSNAHELTVLTLELDESLKPSQKVLLSIKPLNISIAKNFMGKRSDSNRIEATITAIKVGHLLCTIKLQSYNDEFEVIITRDAYSKMKLKIQELVTLFINAHTISIDGVVE